MIENLKQPIIKGFYTFNSTFQKRGGICGIRQGNLYKKEGDVAPKFTFHVSGYYKGEESVGIDPKSLDRPTIKGLPLNEINEPKRTLEILLPKNLNHSKHIPKQDDLVLSLNPDPQIPLSPSFRVGINKFYNYNWLTF